MHGQIVIPEEYQRMADEYGEDEDDDQQERQDESEHGEEGV
jgi:hypothetical protein